MKDSLVFDWCNLKWTHLEHTLFRENVENNDEQSSERETYWMRYVGGEREGVREINLCVEKGEKEKRKRIKNNRWLYKLSSTTDEGIEMVEWNHRRLWNNRRALPTGSWIHAIQTISRDSSRVIRIQSNTMPWITYCNR